MMMTTMMVAGVNEQQMMIMSTAANDHDVDESVAANDENIGSVK